MKKQYLGRIVLAISPLLAAASSRLRSMPLPPPPTEIQHLADSFASVELQQGDDDNRKEIPIDPLLDACRKMVSVLHKTSPKAVADDFSNNLLKVQSLYERDVQRHPRVATMSSLLRHERDSGVHQYSPDGGSSVLSDPSGAMGLLWIRRSLAFQLDFFDHLSVGNDPKTAAMRAYQAQLQPYHGWALRNVNRVILKAHMPNTSSSLLAKLGGYEDNHLNTDKHKHEKATKEVLRRLVNTWRPLLDQWKQNFVDLGLEDTRKV